MPINGDTDKTDKKKNMTSVKENHNGTSLPELVNVQINGKWHKFPKGMRIIEAIKKHEIEVPHYCYHEKLSSPGNCRMCMVEVGMPPRVAPGKEPAKDKDGFPKLHWSPRPMISCANYVSDNMGLRTNSDFVKKAREGIMEFLLINHPLDCPICDQAGECNLQEYSVEYGKGESRFEDNKVKKPKNVKIGPRVTLDNERCILCTRCIRFCDEIVDDNVLGIGERGSYNKIITFPGDELKNNYSLNTVDICPVGALTSTDFRFKMRTWFLKSQNSICTGCSTGCNIKVESRNETIYRLTPRNNDDVNSSWMCDEGRLTYKILQDSSRITSPRIKSKNILQNTNWNDSINELVDDLKKFKSQEIHALISADATNEECFLIKKICDNLKINYDNITIINQKGEGDNYLVNADKNSNLNGCKIFIKNVHKHDAINHLTDKIKSKVTLIFDFKGNIISSLNDSIEKLGKLYLFGLISENDIKNNLLKNGDTIFPLAGFSENQGSIINASGRLQKLNPTINLRNEIKLGWETLNQILVKLNQNDEKNDFKTFFDIYNQMVSEFKEFKELSWNNITDLGKKILQTNNKIKLLENEQKRISSGEING